MPDLPNLFLASSNEGRPFAEALQIELTHDCVPQGWWSLFGNKPGATNLEQLLDLLHFDFAVMLLTRDDRLWHRKKEFDAPRDNLIFELGLFMGALGGPERVFFVVPAASDTTGNASDFRIPSDLTGINGIEYDRRLSPNTATLSERRTAMSPVATVIRDQIRRLGGRQSVLPVTPIGVSSSIIFHPVVQLGKGRLRLRLGYTGEGLLYDLKFGLHYVEAARGEDGPHRSWTTLSLERSEAPEIRFSFNVAHSLSAQQLPNGATTLEELRALAGVLHFTVQGTDSLGRYHRNRRAYAMTDILEGRFVSLIDDDLPLTELDSKPLVNWSRFGEFERKAG